MRHTPTTTATALALTGLAALGLTACDRGGNNGASSNGGGTTIIQTIAQTPSTSNAPAVTPISDPKKLCHLFMARVQEINNAIDSYWKLTVGDNNKWSWGDPNISKAADNAKEVTDKVAPILLGSIGPDIPKDQADPLRAYVSTAQDFAKAIGERSSPDDLNSLNEKLNDELPALNRACGY
ncbi:hypothetical protein Srot_1154 [Segniliparus rotundus DSM 44985]|uniref:Lipoprotein n=1 Tax=Segniliparus rotundus (strain ATCC BAA-972 / CDC 1076 / CIP 108378 / DSM 44985 / JCM 13578) TaxID=640132 RepID=D6ZFA2_SEGRD|nr:hypothetical protein [Segniliparus rotundus]ADG97626.1 hypothetical protein Srot_1154 [Segniliparus rotundus DSM 44985]